ncbi:hypothetical protein K8P01_25940 [Mycolicibacterium smegmatis]|nr:hypothetical protein K8P01_25940 [Mycolicibacterium smegmatis]
MMSPNDLLRDGRMDVELLRAEQSELNSIAGTAVRLDVDAAPISEAAFVDAVADARTTLNPNCGIGRVTREHLAGSSTGATDDGR